MYNLSTWEAEAWASNITQQDSALPETKLWIVSPTFISTMNERTQLNLKIDFAYILKYL